MQLPLLTCFFCSFCSWSLWLLDVHLIAFVIFLNTYFNIRTLNLGGTPVEFDSPLCLHSDHRHMFERHWFWLSETIPVMLASWAFSSLLSSPRLTLALACYNRVSSLSIQWLWRCGWKKYRKLIMYLGGGDRKPPSSFIWDRTDALCWITPCCPCMQA